LSPHSFGNPNQKVKSANPLFAVLAPPPEDEVQAPASNTKKIDLKARLAMVAKERSIKAKQKEDEPPPPDDDDDAPPPPED